MNYINSLDKKEKIILIIVPVIIFILLSIILYNLLYGNVFNYSKKGSTYLKDIIIDGHTITFKKNKYEYNVFLNNDETSLKINAIPVDRSANVKIVNNDDITSHDKIYIYVTSKNHEVKTYTINYYYRYVYNYYYNNIDNCNKIYSNYCIKYFNINNDKYDQSLVFSQDYITSQGYPNTNIITLNDNEIFNKKLNNGEFRNFKVINDNIVFTYNNRNDKKIYLFSSKVNGKINFDYEIINEELNNLYIYNVNYKENNINIKTKLIDTSKKNLCKLDDYDIVEARYIIKYDNKFSVPIKTSQLTNLEYKIIMNINC